jgi:mannose-6-phosphate isomerase
MNTQFLNLPLLFEPLMVERVWGGNRLQAMYGKPIPSGKTIGESWELCDRAEARTRVASGPFSGQTLRQLLEAHPVELLGPKLAAARPKWFPLLIKYVDAGAALSVQVHPDDRMAKEFNDRGKSECWVVVHADPQAAVTRGLRPGTTRADYEAAVREDRVEEVLHAFKPRVGDLLALPPGMVHAIGAGIVVAEIQQNSDLTFRIHDYKRLGLDGKPRQLHIAEALRAIRFDSFGEEFAGDMGRETVQPLKTERHGANTAELLLNGMYFDLARLTVTAGALPLPPSPEAARVVMVVAGAGRIGGVPVKAGNTLLIPAAAPELSLATESGSPLVALVSCPTEAAC